jgi:hypothetical protein
MFLKNWHVTLVSFLLAITGTLYFIDVRLFHNPKDTFYWFMMNLSFLPVDVLLVVVVLNNLFGYREKKAMLAKLNMVIGVFFIEIGKDLLKKVETFNTDSTNLGNRCLISTSWNDQSFDDAAKEIKSLKFKIDFGRGNPGELRDYLSGKRDFLLRLLENPNLMEHESFSDLLWAVMHLGEELAERVEIKNISQKDTEHLAGDIKRAYVLLIAEWLAYMKHLNKNYPYLYSLAVRTNPFNPASRAEIE